MENKSGYIGRIGNTGAQEVKAPLTQKPGKQPKVKSGEDLRGGTGRKPKQK